MRVPIALLLAAISGAECQRAAPEDFAQHGGSVPSGSSSAPASTVDPAAPQPTAAPESPATASAASHGDASRCVLPTPQQAPPPVAPGPAAGCPADPEGGSGKLPVVRVAFPDTNGVGVDAELVRSEHDTMRGLMYRKSMGAERGMLFDLTVRDDHKFWMHNTCIPLDLLYIDEDGLLVGIVENAPTLDDDSRGVGCPSRYVLEVNAGWSRRHGVKAGQHVRIP
jgi:uncharacterized membrane protein (UPF0127 family)